MLELNQNDFEIGNFDVFVISLMSMTAVRTLFGGTAQTAQRRIPQSFRFNNATKKEVAGECGLFFCGAEIPTFVLHENFRK